MAGTPIETDKDKLPTKQEAIALAMKNQEGKVDTEEDDDEGGEEEQEEKPVKKPAKKDEKADEEEDEEEDESGSDDSDDVDESEEEDEEESPEEQAAWKTLQRMMKNPATRKDAVLALAQLSGIELTGTVDTEAGKKKTTKTIKDIVKEKMGDEADLLPDSLWLAIESLVDSKVEVVSRQQLEAAQTANVDLAQKTQTRLEKKYADYKALLPEILRLTQQYPIPAGMPIPKHMEDIYWMAKSAKERKGTPVNKERERRIAANEKKVLPKGSTNRGEGGGGEEDKPFVAKTPKEAAQYAIALFEKKNAKKKARA